MVIFHECQFADQNSFWKPIFQLLDCLGLLRFCFVMQLINSLLVRNLLNNICNSKKFPMLIHIWSTSYDLWSLILFFEYTSGKCWYREGRLSYSLDYSSWANITLEYFGGQWINLKNSTRILLSPYIFDNAKNYVLASKICCTDNKVTLVSLCMTLKNWGDLLMEAKSMEEFSLGPSPVSPFRDQSNMLIQLSTFIHSFFSWVPLCLGCCNSKLTNGNESCVEELQGIFARFELFMKNAAAWRFSTCKSLNRCGNVL